jgi:hypothetical protein
MRRAYFKMVLSFGLWYEAIYVMLSIRRQRWRCLFTIYHPPESFILLYGLYYVSIPYKK